MPILFAKFIFITFLIKVMVLCYSVDNLISAIRMRNVGIVKIIIDDFGNFENWIDNYSRDLYTVLHYAVSGKRVNLELVEFLLEEGADIIVNARTVFGKTPLHMALLNKHHFKPCVDDELYHVVEILLDAGANFRALDNNYCSVLHMVTREDVARLMISLGSNVNARDQFGQTPAHAAVLGNHLNVLRVLIEIGEADLRIADMHGDTVVHINAHCIHSAEIVKLLSKHISLNVRNTDGDTPMTKAIKIPIYYASHGVMKYFHWFIQAGADINATDAQGNTVLHIACRKHNADLVEYFLSNNADVKALNSRGLTPLMQFVKDNLNDNFAKICRALVSKGAEINEIDSNGDSILHLLIYQNRPFQVKVVLALNANPNILNAAKETPLLWLLKNKWETTRKSFMKYKELIFKHLMESDADVHITDAEGRTPMYYANARKRNMLPLTSDEKIPAAVIKTLELRSAKVCRNKLYSIFGSGRVILNFL